MAAATAEVHPAPLSFVVPPAVKKSLVEIAQANERTISAELRVALRRHLEQIAAQR